jgi:hypothetical protein
MDTISIIYKIQVRYILWPGGRGLVEMGFGLNPWAGVFSQAAGKTAGGVSVNQIWYRNIR